MPKKAAKEDYRTRWLKKHKEIRFYLTVQEYMVLEQLAKEKGLTVKELVLNAIKELKGDAVITKKLQFLEEKEKRLSEYEKKLEERSRQLEAKARELSKLEEKLNETKIELQKRREWLTVIANEMLRIASSDTRLLYLKEFILKDNVDPWSLLKYRVLQYRA